MFRLFGAKKPDELLAPVQVSPDLVLPKALASHFEDVQKTARKTVVIKATPGDELSLRQSKFGHYPCLPKGFDYPRDKEGRYLYPLAQINLGEVPQLADFPASGYLQFYIGTDDMYGLSFDKTVPSNFNVLFFEEADVQVAEEDLGFLDEVLKYE